MGGQHALAPHVAHGHVVQGVAGSYVTQWFAAQTSFGAQTVPHVPQ
jgi:hypothetical protein